MFELKFAAEVSDLTGTWAVGVFALVYGQYYPGITLPALAEEYQARASQVNCSLDG